ncbi:MAG TPA: type II toxin-antitoxin system VapC family toxin [Mycobacteriales bacterium]|nr:type II toxin-antitoxin system VapC family toxin [Mycobacteriales bacterium]
MKLYLDSSALVKLVQLEAESGALRRYLRRHSDDVRVTSTLARVELIRAVAAGGPRARAHARRVLARLHQVDLSRELLDDAAGLAPGVALRSLDAVHLAAAAVLGTDLRAVVTYDHRMAAAANSLGILVESPR